MPIYTETPSTTAALYLDMVDTVTWKEETASIWASSISVYDNLRRIVATADASWVWSALLFINPEVGDSSWAWSDTVRDQGIFPRPRNPQTIGSFAVDDIVVHRA